MRKGAEAGRRSLEASTIASYMRTCVTEAPEQAERASREQIVQYGSMVYRRYFSDIGFEAKSQALAAAYAHGHRDAAVASVTVPMVRALTVTATPSRMRKRAGRWPLVIANSRGDTAADCRPERVQAGRSAVGGVGEELPGTLEPGACIAPARLEIVVRPGDAGVDVENGGVESQKQVTDRLLHEGRELIVVVEPLALNPAVADGAVDGLAREVARVLAVLEIQVAAVQLPRELEHRDDRGLHCRPLLPENSTLEDSTFQLPIPVQALGIQPLPRVLVEFDSGGSIGLRRERRPRPRHDARPR